MPYAAYGRVSTEFFPASIEISDVQYAAAIEGVMNGLIITIDGGFAVQLPEKPEEPPPPTLEQLKAQLRSLVDRAAETERLKYITPGAGQAMTYQVKAAEARTFLSTVDPDPADFPMLSAEVGITAGSLTEVAQIVAAAYSQWQIIGAAIEASRLGGKAAIDAADDATEAQASFDAVTWPTPTV